MARKDNEDSEDRQSTREESDGFNEQPYQFDELQGLFVSYKDDQLNENIRLALKRKSRVRYKCMDTFSQFLAFGTSSGAIYLYKLKSLNNSSCKLLSIIPCDQGSIEVIKFLPNYSLANQLTLLVAIGTSRGSLVVFRLLPQRQTHLNGEDGSEFNDDEENGKNLICDEIYKAESFTNNCSIKLIEYDQDFNEPMKAFNKLYICDTSNRLFLLESSAIFASKKTIRLFSSSNLPSLIFIVHDSNINQISVHRSQLLISTDETTRLFNEQTNQLNVIGKKKRRQGFYGACFFDPYYKPSRILPTTAQQQQSNFSSINSLNNYDTNLLIFVSRTMFRLWQVDHHQRVLFTHQFEPLIKSTAQFGGAVELQSEPLNCADAARDDDDPTSLLQTFERSTKQQVKGDHFHKLIPIYSSTLGNLLLSYTRNELFVLNPIEAKLIVRHSQEEPIVQVCCNENRIFIWSSTIDEDHKHQIQVKRFVLLAPTQFVLELHRLHRYVSLIAFVQLFCGMFRRRMALPLHGMDTITVEGGLLRNVLLNAWDLYETRRREQKIDDSLVSGDNFGEFKKMVGEIIEESQQLKHSIEDITNSRFFLTMTSENIDRLCSEPYASLVSLEISIADLHTTNVVRFSKDALDRHKSVANLSQSIRNIKNSGLYQRNTGTRSNFDLRNHKQSLLSGSLCNNNNIGDDRLANNQCGSTNSPIDDAKVIVERQKPRKLIDRPKANGNDPGIEEKKVLLEAAVEGPRFQKLADDSQPFFSLEGSALRASANDRIASCGSLERLNDEEVNGGQEEIDSGDESLDTTTSGRCKSCLWPHPGIKFPANNLSSKQRAKLRWLEENLLGNFEENIDQIEDYAFKHALWELYLKCLSFKQRYDDYIICCISLGDVRLLDIEQFAITRGGEEEMLDRLLRHLKRNIDLGKGVCFKCGTSVNMGQIDDDYQDNEQMLQSKQNESGEKFHFNLINIIEQFLMKRNADISKLIGCLLKHPELLNSSKIPSSFYLKAIERAASNFRRPLINNQIKETTRTRPTNQVIGFEVEETKLS